MDGIAQNTTLEEVFLWITTATKPPDEMASAGTAPKAATDLDSTAQACDVVKGTAEEKAEDGEQPGSSADAGPDSADGDAGAEYTPLHELPVATQVWRQTSILLGKNWALVSRNRQATAVQIAMPFLVTFMLWVLQLSFSAWPLPAAPLPYARPRPPFPLDCAVTPTATPLSSSVGQREQQQPGSHPGPGLRGAAGHSALRAATLGVLLHARIHACRRRFRRAHRGAAGRA